MQQNFVENKFQLNSLHPTIFYRLYFFVFGLYLQWSAIASTHIREKQKTVIRHRISNHFIIVVLCNLKFRFYICPGRSMKWIRILTWFCLFLWLIMKSGSEWVGACGVQSHMRRYPCFVWLLPVHRTGPCPAADHETNYTSRRARHRVRTSQTSKWITKLSVGRCAVRASQTLKFFSQNLSNYKRTI